MSTTKKIIIICRLLFELLKILIIAAVAIAGAAFLIWTCASFINVVLNNYSHEAAHNIWDWNLFVLATK